MRPKRIGILGGSFDPPHLAHLALARVAIRALQLDELRWLPARAPWQKAGREMADAAHRVAMLRLLIGAEPRCIIDEREIARDGPTYTIDSVRELCVEQPLAQWFLIVGQDQYGRFDTWRDWRELLARVTLAVAARSGQAPSPPATVASVPHRRVALELPQMDVSASDIRTRCAVGAEIVSLVGEAVAGYIDSHALYTGRPRS